MRWYAALFHGEGLQTLPKLIDAVHPVLEEIELGMAVIEHISAHRRDSDQVCTRSRPEVDVCSFRHLVLAGIGDDQPLSM